MDKKLFPDAIIPDNILPQLKDSIDSVKLLMTYYTCAIMEIETKFKVLNQQFSLQQEHNPIESIKTRLKSPQSIIGKLNRKGLPLTVEAVENNLNDVAGIRVVCSFVQDIYMLADCLLKQDDVYLIARKDYIENPKENGYRSLHLIVQTPIFLKEEKRMVKVEVQLRTIAMDFWASLEHRLRYKKELNPDISDYLSSELKNCADQSAGLDRRMENVKNLIETEGKNSD